MKRDKAALHCSHRELNRAVLSRQHLIERLPLGIDVGAALDPHRVVKASLMRGTLHVVGAAEYRCTHRPSTAR